MNEREMFEKSFERPKNFFRLPLSIQWQIDKELGILDWKGENLNDEDKLRYENHFEKETTQDRIDMYEGKGLHEDPSYEIPMNQLYSGMDLTNMNLTK